MHFAGKPELHAEIVSAVRESASDPYCGTPLGVEAAWCPSGIDVPRVVAATETRLLKELQMYPGVSKNLAQKRRELAPEVYGAFRNRGSDPAR
jgi:hypothetical protein